MDKAIAMGNAISKDYTQLLFVYVYVCWCVCVLVLVCVCEITRSVL